MRGSLRVSIRGRLCASGPESIAIISKSLHVWSRTDWSANFHWSSFPSVGTLIEKKGFIFTTEYNLYIAMIVTYMLTRGGMYYTFEAYLHRKDAEERERFFKTGWGRQYIKRVLKYYFSAKT